MKVLVLGATGMLGHRVLIGLADRFEVVGAVRDAAAASQEPALRGRRLVGGFDAFEPASHVALIEEIRPDVILNCVGVIKQIDAAKSPIPSITINSLFPHVLAEHAAKFGARVIHFSTDCVFSGRGGPYRETDPSDATDLYGRSKLLGELDEPNALTLRTSIIGHEIRGGHGLLEWFLRNRGGRVSGYAGALYSGVTTNQMANVLSDILTKHPEMTGVWQVAAAPIDKFSLLGVVNDVYGLGIAIDRNESLLCDRRLDGQRFASATGIVIPPWREMIETMHHDHHNVIRANGA